MRANAPRPPPSPPMRSGSRDNDPPTGLFFMLLMAAAMVLLAWDLAAHPGWSGLSVVHAAMQTLLLMAAVAAGCTGAVLWIGTPQRGVEPKSLQAVGPS